MDREECNICNAIKIGIRFVPSPHEVLLDYLIPVIQKKPLPCDHLIKEADVYGASSTPWEIFEDDDPFWMQSGSSDKKRTMYVFTRLSKNGKRVSRRAGCGTWIGQSNKKIKDKKSNENIGCRGAFTFKIDKKMRSVVECDDRWCMYEYTLDDKFARKLGMSQVVEGYAICEIIKRPSDDASENAGNLLEVSNQYDTDSSMIVDEVNQILPVAQGVPKINHEPWIYTDYSMTVGEVNQILPVAQGVPYTDHEPWIYTDYSMTVGEVNQILPVAQGVPYTDHEPWIDTESSVPVDDVNQILPVAQGVPYSNHEPWIDTDYSMPVGEINQIVPVAQGVPNIDQEPWIVNGRNHSQAANPQHVFNQNYPNTPMFPADTDQSVPVAPGVFDNVQVPDNQPGTVNGNNQFSATDPMMDDDELQSLLSFFESLPQEEFVDFTQKQCFDKGSLK